jgi:hypothetical protein
MEEVTAFREKAVRAFYALTAVWRLRNIFDRRFQIAD